MFILFARCVGSFFGMVLVEASGISAELQVLFLFCKVFRVAMLLRALLFKQSQWRQFWDRELRVHDSRDSGSQP